MEPKDRRAFSERRKSGLKTARAWALKEMGDGAIQLHLRTPRKHFCWWHNCAVRVDPIRFGAHSLRSGLATQSARNGTLQRSIIRQTGHRSVGMVRRYVHEAELFLDKGGQQARALTPASNKCGHMRAQWRSPPGCRNHPFWILQCGVSCASVR